MITFYKPSDAGVVRYYSVHDRQGSLFLTHGFTAVWGSFPKAGRERVYTFEDRESMDRKLREIFRRRVRDGYRVLYSFSRNQRYVTLFEEFRTREVG